MNCPNCNAELPDNTKVCPQCKINITEETASSKWYSKKSTPLLNWALSILIIAVILAIILARFVEPKRPRPSRTKGDQRTIATALEAYYLDNECYPASVLGEGSANSFAGPKAGVFHIPTFPIWKNKKERERFFTLTTPIAYMQSYFADPFADTKGATFGYYSDGKGWIIWSWGPDRDENKRDEWDLYPDVVEGLYRSDIPQPSLELICGSSSVGAHHAYTYDPTNGTISPGDVYRVK